MDCGRFFMCNRKFKLNINNKYLTIYHKYNNIQTKRDMIKTITNYEEETYE